MKTIKAKNFEPRESQLQMLGMRWNGTSEQKLSLSKERREHRLFFQTENIIYGNLAGRRLQDNEKPHHKILQITAVNGRDKGLYVIGQINYISYRMVVDTGANVSIIRKYLAQNTKVSIIWTLPCVPLQTVTGDKIQVHGKANITLRFGNIDYHHTAYIADITDPCILGLDFLKNNNFKLDFENSNMHSKFEDITLFGLQTQFESNQKIIAKTKFSLSPRTECIIHGLVAENRKFGFGLIDYPDPESSKAGILIASSVVDLLNSDIPERMANISDKTRTVVLRNGSLFSYLTCCYLTRFRNVISCCTWK
ncbi:retrovirus-related Pol polyprotein from transposon 412 [Trichonephila clavipes]|uniref:Retrovirus-related Pol polyprotein from transposon 412 n=1 Tax=Trichonephila clavipes TaxID=2585209 RepID=A0A8X6VLS8_TRICX|nr:retrovirus-related Pol polyprotein from transposon 412 [Trichonephila clavipes]